jgi:hypothetical protein
MQDALLAHAQETSYRSAVHLKVLSSEYGSPQDREVVERPHVEREQRMECSVDHIPP